MHTENADKRRLMLLGAGTALVLFGLLHADTAVFLSLLWWQHQAYGHGLLLIPVGLYMLWMRRQQLAMQPWQPSLLGLGFLVGVALIAWLGAISGIDLLSQMAFAAAPIGIVWSLFGFAVVRVAAFPLGCMLLVIPVWDVLIPPLQEITTVAATHILRFIGVPVHVEGHYMTIPRGQFAIERVCAGLRYLLAMVSIATLFAYMHLRSPLRASVFIIVSVLLSVVFNWIRVTGIIFAGYVTEMRSSLVHDHEFFGWVLFTVALAPLLWLGSRLADTHKASSDGTTANRISSETAAPAQKPALTIACVLALVTAPTAAAWLLTQQGQSPGNADIAPIRATAAWRGPLAATAEWQPIYGGATALHAAAYEFAGESVQIDLRLAYFATNVQGSELVSVEHADYRESNWRRVREFKRALPNEPPIFETLVRATGGGSTKTRLIWRWFVIGERTTNSPEKAKLLGLLGRLSGDPSGAIVAVSTASQTENIATMRERLALFVANMAPAINQRIASLSVD